jgi:hypothetical protein
MNKAAVLNHQDTRYKAQASHCLTEAQRILRGLAAERRRSTRRRAVPTSLVKEVKAILKGG